MACSGGTAWVVAPPSTKFSVRAASYYGPGTGVYVIKIAPIPDQRIQAVRRIIDETSPATQPDPATIDPYADNDTLPVDGLGLRWTTTVVDQRQTRTQAVALAHAVDRVAATPTALAAHLTPMKAANPKLRVLGWIDPAPGTDITQPASEQSIVDSCLHAIDASGYDGCLLNLPLIPPQTCSSAPTPDAGLPMPTTAGDTEPATATSTPAPPPTATQCPTTAQWQSALRTVVTDLTKQNETDVNLLVLINSDGTQSIVKADA